MTPLCSHAGGDSNGGRLRWDPDISWSPTSPASQRHHPPSGWHCCLPPGPLSGYKSLYQPDTELYAVVQWLIWCEIPWSIEWINSTTPKTTALFLKSCLMTHDIWNVLPLRCCPFQSFTWNKETCTSWDLRSSLQLLFLQDFIKHSNTCT